MSDDTKDKPCPDCGFVHGEDPDGPDHDGRLRLHNGDACIVFRHKTGVMQTIMPTVDQVQADGRVAAAALAAARCTAVLVDDNEDLLKQLDERAKARSEGFRKLLEAEEQDTGAAPSLSEALKSALKTLAKKLGAEGAEIVRIDAKTGEVTGSQSLDFTGPESAEGKPTVEEHKPSDGAFVVPGPKSVN